MHSAIFNEEHDNPLVLPWFNNAENDAPKRPDIFGHLGGEGDFMELDEPLSFNPMPLPHVLTFGQPLASATLHVPADGYGAMELDVPCVEGGSTVQAIWDGSTQTMKVTIGENLRM